MPTILEQLATFSGLQHEGLHDMPTTRGGGVASSVIAAALTACGGALPTVTADADGPAALQGGEELYVATCQRCHGDETGAGGVPGAPPHHDEGHTWHHPDAQLIDWILNGKPFTAMPAFGDRLNEADANATLAYIKTWWTDEQRAEQADVSERYQEALDAQNESP